MNKKKSVSLTEKPSIVLVLTGCVSTSPGIPNLFLASIEAPTLPVIRVGYFGK